MKDAVILTGAGQIGMAIARRVGYGKKIVVGDRIREMHRRLQKTMNDAGFDAEAMEMDLSSRESILSIIERQRSSVRSALINAAGVSPSQASVEAILNVDLYGTAVLLEEVGKVIKEGGVGVTISSQSGHRMPALSASVDEQLATTPTEELLDIEVLKPENIKDTLHAYQMAKRCNEKRVMAEAVKWGGRGARINSISPGIVVTPLAMDEFHGPREIFIKNMCSQNVRQEDRELQMRLQMGRTLMSDKAAFTMWSGLPWLTGSYRILFLWAIETED